MKTDKTVLTTGQVAKICNVAPRTVSKWFDQGYLHGYRIPGSKDRRILLDQLIRFMRANGMPLNGLDTGKTHVVLLAGDVSFSEALADALTDRGRYEVSTATSAFEAGAVLKDLKPQVVVADVALPDVIPESLVRFVRSSQDLQTIKLIGIAPELGNGRGEALVQGGFNGYLSKPFETRSLVSMIEGLCEELHISD